MSTPLDGNVALNKGDVVPKTVIAFSAGRVASLAAMFGITVDLAYDLVHSLVALFRAIQGG